MDLNDKVTQLEDEIKILKNEVQAVLLDLRVSFLNNVNPFNPNPLPVPPQSEIVEVRSSVDKTAHSSPGKQELDEDDDMQVYGTDEDGNEIVDLDDSDGNEDFENDGLINRESVSFMPASNGDTKTTPKRKNMRQNQENNISSQYKSYGTVTVNNNTLDLTTMESLSGWVEDSVQRLGHERTRMILDVIETMGYMTSELKNILVKLIHPISDDGETTKSNQDYLSSLIELNKLLGIENRMEIALLYILCQENENR